MLELRGSFGLLGVAPQDDEDMRLLVCVEFFDDLNEESPTEEVTLVPVPLLSVVRFSASLLTEDDTDEATDDAVVEETLLLLLRLLVLRVEK